MGRRRTTSSSCADGLRAWRPALPGRVEQDRGNALDVEAHPARPATACEVPACRARLRRRGAPGHRRPCRCSLLPHRSRMPGRARSCGCRGVRLRPTPASATRTSDQRVGAVRGLVRQRTPWRRGAAEFPEVLARGHPPLGILPRSPRRGHGRGGRLRRRVEGVQRTARSWAASGRRWAPTAAPGSAARTAAARLGEHRSGRRPAAGQDRIPGRGDRAGEHRVRGRRRVGRVPR